MGGNWTTWGLSPISNSWLLCWPNLSSQVAVQGIRTTKVVHSRAQVGELLEKGGQILLGALVVAEKCFVRCQLLFECLSRT